jgi:hypothetical protein
MQTAVRRVDLPQAIVIGADLLAGLLTPFIIAGRRLWTRVKTGW